MREEDRAEDAAYRRRHPETFTFNRYEYEWVDAHGFYNHALQGWRVVAGLMLDGKLLLERDRGPLTINLPRLPMTTPPSLTNP